MAKVNLQNQPKDREYLSCMISRPGYQLVSMDFAALEPKVLTYFCRDPNMLSLYSETAQPNDVYLFNAAKSTLFGREVMATGYDPDNPTLESIKGAKKQCNKIRKISKEATLSFNYGASAGKIHNELLVKGIKCSFQEVQRFHRSLSDLYPGIIQFGKNLKRSWEYNAGHIINGFNRPIAIDYGKLKDINNRFIQSTGHDILMDFNYHLALQLDQAVKEWHPWIWDYHDEVIIEVPESEVDMASRCFVDVLQATNDRMGWDVKMDGEVMVADNLADIKVEDD